jgi:hypothetical protein
LNSSRVGNAYLNNQRAKIKKLGKCCKQFEQTRSVVITVRYLTWYHACRVFIATHILKFCHMYWSICFFLKNSGIVLQQEPHSSAELHETANEYYWHKQARRCKKKDVCYDYKVNRE